MNITLETTRLFFTPATPEHIDWFYKLRGDPQVMQYIHGGGRSYKEVTQELSDEIQHQKLHGFSKWSCFDKASAEFVGRAGFAVMKDGGIEVGYGFLPEYWGKGYATEALDGLLKWAFQHIDKAEIIAFVDVNNQVSQKVIEKCGMKFYQQDQLEGRLYDFYYKRRDGFELKVGKVLAADQLEYIEGGFSQIAHTKDLPPVESFCITLSGDKGKIMATVYGSIYYGSMYIDTIYVDELLRQQGYGRELMDKAEKLALGKNCTFITLATMDWEARGFYEKLGYHLEFERQGYMKGAKMYLLRKDLT